MIVIPRGSGVSWPILDVDLPAVGSRVELCQVVHGREHGRCLVYGGTRGRERRAACCPRQGGFEGSGRVISIDVWDARDEVTGVDAWASDSFGAVRLRYAAEGHGRHAAREIGVCGGDWATWSGQVVGWPWHGGRGGQEIGLARGRGHGHGHGRGRGVDGGMAHGRASTAEAWVAHPSLALVVSG